MRAVDTNVLVRLIVRDDERQVAVAQAFVERGVWVSLFVLAEMVWVLRSVYRRDQEAIAIAVEMLLENPTVTMQDSDVVAAALEQYRLAPSLGFSDCMLLEIARKAGHLPLGTFDRKLSRLDGTERLS
jgi:predicted nucleic-acid-binding protein